MLEIGYILLIPVLYMFMRMMDSMNHMNSTDLYKQHNRYLLYDRIGDIEQDIIILKQLMTNVREDVDGEDYVPRHIYEKDIRGINDIKDRLTMLENDVTNLAKSDP